MPELRHNPITGHWVIIAENRGSRPRDFVVQQTMRESGDNCPFCQGNEHLTPGEVFALRKDGTTADAPGWLVRVIPNKYPATTEVVTGVRGQESEPERSLHGDDQALLRMSQIYRHEVIIESPRHVLSVAELSDDEFAQVLAAYRARFIAIHRTQPRGNIVIFKNSGPTAGATLAHLHSQIIASRLFNHDQTVRFLAFGAPFLPKKISCPACTMILDPDQRYVVAESANFIAFCPFASRFPYETWILPLAHAAHYDQLNPKSLPELASLFRGLLVKLEKVLQSPAYNYILHTAPFDTPRADHYHWHIEILPRITTLGGFELGTGCYINPLPPERAAEELRQA